MGPGPAAGLPSSSPWYVPPSGSLSSPNTAQVTSLTGRLRFALLRAVPSRGARASHHGTGGLHHPAARLRAAQRVLCPAIFTIASLRYMHAPCAYGEAWQLLWRASACACTWRMCMADVRQIPLPCQEPPSTLQCVTYKLAQAGSASFPPRLVRASRLG